MGRLRVALMVDQLQVDSYVYQICEYLLDNQNFENPVLITGYCDDRNELKILRKFLFKIKAIGFIRIIPFCFFYLLRLLITRIELRFVHKVFPKYGKLNCLNSLNLEIMNLEGFWSKGGAFLEFDHATLEKIAERRFDVLIRCGSGILRGPVLKIPKHGILSFHHGDNRKNRGGPAGFWEVFNDDSSSGFIIQRLTEELDGGEVLYRGNIRTSKFWLLNEASLKEKSNIFMLKVLEDLQKTEILKTNDPASLHNKELYKLNDDPFLLLRYMAKIYFPVVRDKLKGIFQQNSWIIYWSIAYAPYSKLRKSIFRYREIPNPKNRYLADPFVITHEGRSICFVEDFFIEEGKGRISAIELREEKEEFLGVVLEEDFHLSFPFIFMDGDQIYMVPESHQSKQIRLYRCDEFPKKWVFERTLMENVSAADTVIIKKDDFWFMLSNIDSSEIIDHNSELHIFYSKDLLTNDWSPLDSGNPVIFDSQRARNGGIFVHDGKLIRVSQQHNKSIYGSAFTLNEVIELSPRRYEEKQIDTILPKFKKEIVATHHFHTDRSYSVIDFMRHHSILQESLVANKEI